MTIQYSKLLDGLLDGKSLTETEAGDLMVALAGRREMGDGRRATGVGKRET